MPRIRDYAFNSSQCADESCEDEEKSVSAKMSEPAFLREENSKKEIVGENSEKDTQSEPVAVNAVPAQDKLSVQKIVKTENDLSGKYSKAEDAINSILTDGDYYEDYARAQKAGLTSSKDFVLSVIAQNYDRFYSPLTPKPAEWFDEEYLTARISRFFLHTREAVTSEQTNELAESLYAFLEKSAFSTESRQAIADCAKRVLKVNSARILTVEEGDRLKTSIERFSSALNGAMLIANEKRSALERFETARISSLKSEKDKLNSIIDTIKC